MSNAAFRLPQHQWVKTQIRQFCTGETSQEGSMTSCQTKFWIECNLFRKRKQRKRGWMMMAFQLTMGLYRESRDVVRVGQGVPLHPSISKKSSLILTNSFQFLLKTGLKNLATINWNSQRHTWKQILVFQIRIQHTLIYFLLKDLWLSTD